MLRTIRKLLGEKSNQIKFPIALMGADAVLSIVLYVGATVLWKNTGHRKGISPQK